MEITASMVKELRERTGAGMMECKKALGETNGDQAAAVELLRKRGEAKAEKKAGRIAAEGVIGLYADEAGKLAALVEINCETDFVAKQESFQEFANAVARRVAEDAPADVDSLMALPLTAGGGSVEDGRKELIAKLGENINVRRFARIEATGGAGISQYLHGARIGVLVESEGGRGDLGRDIAMHVAASRPMCVSGEQVPADVLEKEKEIFRAQAAESGKPAEIIEKMITGRVNKFLGEVTLLGQPFVKDPNQSVEKLLKAEGASVRQFVRFEVGEGIEKRTEDFAAEVMSQAKGA
jgi:elongation factor Ts